MTTSSLDMEKLCDDFITKNTIIPNNESKVDEKTSNESKVDEKTSNESKVEDKTKKEEKLYDNLSFISQEICKNLSENFIKCIKGYHLINDNPIKESLWEDINAQVLNASGFNINSQSNGSHKSGADLVCSLGAFSNKSAKYEISLDKTDKMSFKLSSYRLTAICSEKTNGKIENIITEINKRTNFKYYSIILRNEKNKIKYDWYLIPSNYPQFNPSSYKWIPMIGKRGKNKDSIIGWKTNTINDSSMSITFSMSSQLWINIVIIEEMKKYLISSCKVNKEKILNYIKLYENNYLR